MYLILVLFIWYCLQSKLVFNNVLWHVICPIWKDLFHNLNDCKCTTDDDACGVVDFCDMRDDDDGEKTTRIERSELLFFLTQVNTSFQENGNSPSFSSSSSIRQTFTQNTQKQALSEWRVKNWFNRILYFLFPFLIYKNPSSENK